MTGRWFIDEVVALVGISNVTSSYIIFSFENSQSKHIGLKFCLNCSTMSKRKALEEINANHLPPRDLEAEEEGERRPHKKASKTCLLAKGFATDDVAWVKEREGDLLRRLPSWLQKKTASRAHDPSVAFLFQDGTAVTRIAIWQAMHVFCNHTATTPMPAGIVYPGLNDPGVGVVLPLTYASYQGLVHLVACLTVHASGANARGSATTLEITVARQPTFSVNV